MQRKIEQMEAMFRQFGLASGMPNPAAMMMGIQPPPMLGFNRQSLQHLLINDFSPNWDYTTGGQGIIVCLQPVQVMDSIF